MNDADYTSTQYQLMILATIVSGLDLDGFLKRIDMAEAAGPILDPTMYRAAMTNLNSIKRLAIAANEFRKEALAQTGPTNRSGSVQ